MRKRKTRGKANTLLICILASLVFGATCKSSATEANKDAQIIVRKPADTLKYVQLPTARLFTLFHSDKKKLINIATKRLLIICRGGLDGSHQLLVSLANGQLVALDNDSGDILWTFDSGTPLLSSANPGAAAVNLEGSPGDISGVAPPKEGIFPSTDGSLYVYRADDKGLPRIEVGI